jgi:hypothetical protein
MKLHEVKIVDLVRILQTAVHQLYNPLEDVFDGRTTSTYEITTSLPKPKLTPEQYAGYAEINISKSKEILENFNVASFFRRALNLEGDAAEGEMEEDISYTLYIAESKRHECPKLKIMIGGAEISALLDTGCVNCRY